MTATSSAAAIERTTPKRAHEVDAAELAAFTGLLRNLDDHEWSLATDCTLWTVRDMVAHVVGETVGLIRPGRWLRDVVVGARRYPQMNKLDALNQLQVDERADCSGPELVDELEALVPARLRARRRVPRVIRRLPMFPGFTLPPGTRIEYMLDIITIRDVWMHRVDISVATGREVALGDHDGEVVRQVVADLGRVWRGPSLELVLEGLAGGSWVVGLGEPRAVVRVDTVEYMRLLAGRPADPKIVVEGDDAVRTSVTEARVVF